MKIESKNFYNLKDIEKENIIQEYTAFQIERHIEKMHKIRDEEFYFDIAKEIESLYEQNVFVQKENYNMICLGTRNNYERNCFSKYFSLSDSLVNTEVYLKMTYNAEISHHEEKLHTKSAQRKWMRDLDLWFRENMSELTDITKKHYYPKSIIDVNSLDISPESEADYIMDFSNLPEDWNSKWDIVYSNCLDHSISATETFEEWIRILQDNGILILGVTFDTEINGSDSCAFDKEQVNKFLNEQKNIKILHTFDVHDYKHYVVKKL